jgi:hypothetical protein
MQISSARFCSSSAALMATALMGLITATTIPQAIAHEAKDRNEMEVGLVGQNPALTARAPETALSYSGRDEASFDVAIVTLFCLEARDAVDKGELTRQGQQWVLINGHRCRDEWLLFDALGF